MRKTYKSMTGVEYIFPVTVGGKARYISMAHLGRAYSTSDRDEQEQIEQSQLFLDGSIFLSSCVAEPGDKDAPMRVQSAPAVEEGSAHTTTGKSHPEADSVQKASNILRTEYGQAPSSVRTAAQVKAKASELGIEFPNLN